MEQEVRTSIRKRGWKIINGSSKKILAEESKIL